MQQFKKLLPVFDVHCNCCIRCSDALSSGWLLSKTNSKKKYPSRSLRHSNNSIIDLAGLHQTLSHFLTQPSELGWLDLSFNKLKHIDPVRLFSSHMFFPLFFLFDWSLTYCQHCLFIYIYTIHLYTVLIVLVFMFLHHRCCNLWNCKSTNTKL